VSHLTRSTPADRPHLLEFLTLVDLTLSGLDDARVQVWIERDAEGLIVGSTGFELSRDGAHALIRSVAVHPSRRTGGHGTRLATFALDESARQGAQHAWLFSRRSGPFWSKLGFAPADRDELARLLASTHQVSLFRETGQLDTEVAWSRPLIEPLPAR
jgi:N-acetylglutamate synthase-like GNAT family acetyltransferase